MPLFGKSKGAHHANGSRRAEETTAAEPETGDVEHELAGVAAAPAQPVAGEGDGWGPALNRAELPRAARPPLRSPKRSADAAADSVPGTGTPHPAGGGDGNNRRLLGSILVEQGHLEEDELAAAIEAHQKSGERLGEALIRSGVLSEVQVSMALAEQYGIEWIDISQVIPDPTVSDRLPEQKARDLNALPLREVDGVLEVIVGNLRPGIADDIHTAVGRPVRVLAVPPSVARHAIDQAFRALAEVDRMVSAFTVGDAPGARQSGTRAREEVESADSPVAKLVTMIATQALRDRASDIHIEPTDRCVRVRFRIDGALSDVLELPVNMGSPLVSRIKILGGMNIVERRKAQDGQFGMRIDEKDIDLRVSTMATVWGEKCVMRVLDKSRSLIRLGDLGMPPDTHIEFSKMVRSPFGMVLCAGPTGSGKTTTLYATMTEIDERTRNVVTIEDPVEYVFPSINQIQTNDQAGITFADGLRAILRQDPDIILVGEIRDQETARIAVQAALTGHFVMSSLHATDSVAALHRFLDMGIEAFLVASSVLGIVSQRLVRRICRSCAAPYTPTDEEMAFYAEGGGEPKERFIHGTGCNFCSNTGYQDRIGVYEFLHMTPEIRRLLVGWATQDELRRVAINQGMRTLRTEGLSLVNQDVTTISEVIRSIYAL
jgi:type IV pilus assembly protein PilB